MIAKDLEYNSSDIVCEGYIAYEESSDIKRPGILVVPNWMGVGDFVKEKCRELASLGYIALAVDVYGKGVRPKNREEAAKLSSSYKENYLLLRKRLVDAMEALKSFELLKEGYIGAIGYCFGGTAVLELARKGVDIKGVVSFHGGLSTLDVNRNPIKAKILVCHGVDDPFVPMSQVEDFIKEMNERKADYQIIMYSDAVHSFTEKAAGDNKSNGSAYNELADKRSWNHMLLFFQEIFR
ncbi:dienelactone hydrolase family protein [Hydrogenobaculum acidophilum]